MLHPTQLSMHAVTQLLYKQRKRSLSLVKPQWLGSFQIFKTYESNLFSRPCPFPCTLIFLDILLIKMYDIATHCAQQVQEQEAPLPRKAQRVRCASWCTL